MGMGYENIHTCLNDYYIRKNMLMTWNVWNVKSLRGMIQIHQWSKKKVYAKVFWNSPSGFEESFVIQILRKTWHGMQG